MEHRHAKLLAAFVLAASAAGCSVTSDDDTALNEGALTSPAIGDQAAGSDNPFDESSCTGNASLTVNEVLRKLQDGRSFASLGSAVLKVQNRRCNAGGCSAWEDATSPAEVQALTPDDQRTATFPLRGPLFLQTSNSGGRPWAGIGLKAQASSPSYRFEQDCWWSRQTGKIVCEGLIVRTRSGKPFQTWSRRPLTAPLIFRKSDAFMGEHCYRFVSSASNVPGNTNVETRFGVLGRF